MGFAIGFAVDFLSGHLIRQLLLAVSQQHHHHSMLHLLSDLHLLLLHQRRVCQWVVSQLAESLLFLSLVHFFCDDAFSCGLLFHRQEVHIAGLLLRKRTRDFRTSSY